ncbi:MAG TPA: hypothetical protein VD838_09655 [Anaeromyxobacteraceae bacterium]|nr:hypothetical protein [Anaeromyxobacteraceae bacterium]
MPDLLVAGIVVPGFVAAAVSALWTFATRRSLHALESRLRREEEGFRLAQSPRVKAAIALWSAFNAFDRAVRDLVAPYAPLDADELTDDERREAFLRHEKDASREVRAAHRKLVVARAEAECLVPAPAFDAFERLLRTTSSAGDRYWASRARELGGPEKVALRREAEDLLVTAEGQRAAVVEALRRMIAEPR